MTDALDVHQTGAGAVTWADVQPQCGVDGAVHVMASSYGLHGQFTRRPEHWCVGIPAAVTRVATVLLDDGKLFITAQLESLDAMHVFQRPWNLLRTNSPRVLSGAVRVHALLSASPSPTAICAPATAAAAALPDAAGDDGVDDNNEEQDAWMLRLAVAKSMPGNLLLAPVRHETAAMTRTHHKTDAHGFPVSHTALYHDFFPNRDDIMRTLSLLARHDMLSSDLQSFVHMLEEREAAWSRCVAARERNRLLLTDDAVASVNDADASFVNIMNEAEDAGVDTCLDFRVRASACFAARLGVDLMEHVPIAMSVRFIVVMTPGEYVFTISVGTNGDVHRQPISVDAPASPATIDLEPFFEPAVDAGNPVTAMFTGMEPSNGISLYRRAMCMLSRNVAGTASPADVDRPEFVRVQLHGTSVHGVCISPHPLLGDKFSR